MQKVFKGKAYVLGDNIDTDQIIPAEHLVYSLSDPEESKKYGHFAMSGTPPAKAGLPDGGIPFIEGQATESGYSIIIAGSNFGCGSSREHAPFALQKAGVKVVVAESYARIFYRNAVDGGFIIPVESVEALKNMVRSGDQVEVDLDRHVLKNLTDGREFALKELGDVLPIVAAGGIFEYARQSGMIT